ncbi:hypothetical protein F0562_029844 [Nyssa sinensis]|uniref:DUF4005 domain-containing protein n=1 Tax=Nyssa sinensis TaxID=561372 RepID=A0A5J5AXA7_9ASTE|nr:hypothetical protein F0562_029844 [Nyssa sinensis]
MGKATRWLKDLFGIKREKEQKENPISGDRKDKKPWSFGHSGRDSGGLCHNPGTIPPNITAAEAAWLRSFYGETEEQQNKKAIAVAAATAAAADAAVAAAQAAVAVVRLTSQGRGTMFGGGHEKWAAVKIQTVFRGYLVTYILNFDIYALALSNCFFCFCFEAKCFLCFGTIKVLAFWDCEQARKALKALKGLVKLQAIVRGFLVRKEATATLHSMQALVRAQATARALKTRGFINNHDRFLSQFRARKSIERFDDIRSEHTTSIHSRRLSASFDSTINTIEGSPKIVEVDTGRPKSRSRRTNTSVSDSGDDPFGQTLSSPILVSRVPARLSIPDCRNFHSTDWGLTGDECRFSTAQSTPRFVNCDRSNAPVTPAKSVCAENYLRQYTNYCPNYMAKTQSFKAKLRSQSAPKQRPEAAGPKKRLSLNEMMESRNSLSGVRMQRSCTQVQEVINFKNAVMAKLDRPTEFVRAAERDCYLQGEMVRDW